MRLTVFLLLSFRFIGKAESTLSGDAFDAFTRDTSITARMVKFTEQVLF